MLEPTAAMASNLLLGAVELAWSTPLLLTLTMLSLLAPARMNQKLVSSWAMPFTTCGVEVVPSVKGTSHWASWPEPKLLTLEVAMVGAGIANSSVAAGKLAADDVATVSPGIAKPAVLVEPVPRYGMEFGIAGSFSGALVLIVIWGTAKVEFI